MGFIDIEQQPAVQPLPGIRLRAPHGERIMLSYLEMEAGAEVPLHSHPHEQAGMLLRGTLELTIGDETRLMQPGSMYIVPGGVAHRAVAVNGPVLVLDIFSPIRNDYVVARPAEAEQDRS